MRNYKHKTDRGNIPNDVLDIAAASVKKGKKIRAVARELKINRTTLGRYLKNLETNPEVKPGCKNSKNAIFPTEIEKDLVNDIKRLAGMVKEFSVLMCRMLAYQLAIDKKLQIPETWENNKKAGYEWWLSFKNRNNIILRNLKAPERSNVTSKLDCEVMDSRFSETLDALCGKKSQQSSERSYNHIQVQDEERVDSMAVETIISTPDVYLT